MRILVAILLTTVAVQVNAQTVTLFCGSQGKGFNVWLNFTNEEIKVHDMVASDIYITENNISFKFGPYQHFLDRTTGQIRIRNMTVPSDIFSLSCRPVNRAF